MTTDLNTLDDWWNEGFDDFFDGARAVDSMQIADDMAAISWIDGRRYAQAYRNAMKGQPDERNQQ